MSIVGTGGHIDHGKTALIRALTGEDTDRLPEEQRRGISIDLGFTHMDVDGTLVGVVDVPGHEDFIRNMLAGATGMDLLLLVVAADEGVMPQTREHLAIAGLLGIPRAVVALTKADLVEPEWLELVRDDVAAVLVDTRYAGAPLIPTSTQDGRGLDAVREAVAEAVTGTRGSAHDLFRMPVDRVFTVRGTGTVVTGSVWSGRLTRGETIRVLPGDLEARVRGLQVHGGDVDAVEAGQRAAVALAGPDKEQIDRGLTLVSHPGWREAQLITARVRVLEDTGWSLADGQRVRVHLGTAEAMARVAVVDGDTAGPGQEKWVQLRMERPLLARARDRFVIRSYSPVTTIAGGVVAEAPARRRRRISKDDSAHLQLLASGGTDAALEALLSRSGGRGVEEVRLTLDTGAPPAAVSRVLEALDTVTAEGRLFQEATARRVHDALLAAVDRHHAAVPLQPGMDPEALRKHGSTVAGPALVDHVLDELLEGPLWVRRRRIGRREFIPSLTPEAEALRDRLAATLAEAGAAAPRLDELREVLDDPPELEDLLALLEADGRVVRLEADLYLDAGAVADVKERVRERLSGREGLKPGDFRDVLEVSRRHLIPVLEYLDREGVTVRGQEGRSVPTG